MRSAPARSKDAAEKPAYIPTEAEAKLMEDWSACPPRLPKVAVKVDENGSYGTSNNHAEQTIGILLIMKALGLTSTPQYSMFIGQALSMTKIEKGERLMAHELNEMIAIVAAQKPRDITESMLCLQMAGMHVATTNALATVRNTDSFEAKIEAGHLASKLSRTFTTQMDALKRYRTKGKPQRVVVEHKHINVAPGGQAIIGDVTTGGGVGVASKTGTQSHERDQQLLLSERTAVLSTIEALGLPMQGAGNDGQESVPVSRGEGRRALRAA